MHGLAAALVLDVIPHTTELTSTVRAHVCIRIDSVPHSCCLDAFIDQFLCRLAPLYDKGYR